MTRLSLYMWADMGPRKGLKASHLGIADEPGDIQTLISQALLTLKPEVDTVFFTIYPDHPQGKPEPCRKFED